MAIDFEDTPADEYCAQTLPAVIKSASITLMAWIKRETNNTHAAVVFAQPRQAWASGRGVYLRASSTGKMSGLFGTGAAFRVTHGTTVLSAGTWYHVAMSFNNTTKDLKVFVDGAEEGSNTFAGDTISWIDGAGGNYPDPAQLYFGAAKDNNLGAGATVPNQHFFDGVMDEICIFDAALTEAQIQSMLHRRQPWHANLAGYWRLDEESGATLVDLKNGNDATLYNAARVANGAPLTYG
jgi:hypothetical protein